MDILLCWWIFKVNWVQCCLRLPYSSKYIICCGNLSYGYREPNSNTCSDCLHGSLYNHLCIYVYLCVCVYRHTPQVAQACLPAPWTQKITHTIGAQENVLDSLKEKISQRLYVGVVQKTVKWLSLTLGHVRNLWNFMTFHCAFTSTERIKEIRSVGFFRQVFSIFFIYSLWPVCDLCGASHPCSYRFRYTWPSSKLIINAVNFPILSKVSNCHKQIVS